MLGTLTNTPVITKAKFLSEIQIAQGIGITLVVVGHLLANATTGPEWYAALKRLIYQFHMPFFMYISGFTFAWTRANYFSFGYSEYIKKRAVRLLIPFLAFGLLILFAKYTAQFFLFVDNPPEGIWDGFVKLVYNTEKSSARSIWYIFALFVFSGITYAFGPLTGKKLWALFALSVIMHLWKVPDILYLNRVFYFYLFFVLGLVAAKSYKKVLNGLEQYGYVAIAIFSITLVALLYWGKISAETKLICGLTSLPALHYLSIKMSGYGATGFGKIGSYSLTIYLMNTLTIGGFKAVYMVILSSANNQFWLYLIGALVSGLFIPIFLYLIVKQYWPRVAWYLK